LGAADAAGLHPGNFGHALYPELDVAEGGRRMRKTRFSALIQGSFDLDAILRARGIDMLIVIGTAACLLRVDGA
jgi:ureidoacrylate peracid hydrolase